MLRFLALMLLVWLLLLPPLFTDGACTAEFEQEASRIQVDGKSLLSPSLASAYWEGRRVPYTILSREQCVHRRPKHIEACAAGPIIQASVQVQNKVCRFYRDDEARVQLHFDAKDRLVRMQTDMNPYKSLPIPLTDITLHWGR
jgi:hypothetical protein